MTFAFACLAFAFLLMRFSFFGREVGRRFNTLFAQSLVLDLLLMLNHPFFLFANQSCHFLLGERFVLEQVFVDKERSPCIRGGITRLFGREMAVLPIGQLLRFGYFFAKTDSEQFLQAEVENTILRHHFLDVDAVGGREIASAAQSVDVILKRQPDLADVLVCEEIREFLRQTDMGEAEEITAVVSGNLYECSRVVNTSLETGPCLRVHTYGFLRAQVSHGVRDLVGLVHHDYLAFERHERIVLQQVLTDMRRLISHVVHVLRLKVYVPNGCQTLRDR